MSHHPLKQRDKNEGWSHGAEQPAVACTGSGDASALHVEPVRETQLQTRHADRNCPREKKEPSKRTQGTGDQQESKEKTNSSCTPFQGERWSSKTTAHPIHVLAAFVDFVVTGKKKQ